MNGRVPKILFGVAVAAGTLWAYLRLHTYATGQDPRTFLVMAKGLLGGGGAGGSWLVVPGWPLVLAGVMKTFGVHAAFWTNVPLFILLVLSVQALAARLAGSWRKGAVVAAGTALLALGGHENNPHFLLWAFRQTPMYLTAVLALLGAERAVARQAEGRLRAAAGWSVAALLAAGAGVLVRETGVLVLPAIGLYWLAAAAGWAGPEGLARQPGRVRWFLVALSAGLGAAGAAAAVAVLALRGGGEASQQAGWMIGMLPRLFSTPFKDTPMPEMLAMIPDELGAAGCLGLAIGVVAALRRRYRGFLFLFLLPALSYLGFDGLFKAHRRFFLSTLFFLSPLVMFGACTAAGWVRRGLERTGIPAAWQRRLRTAGWGAAWAAMVVWCVVTVSRIGPWGVAASRAEVDRALEILAPWTGPGRPVLMDGRARFLSDVLEVFTDWPLATVEPDPAIDFIADPPLVFVRPMNAHARHWAVRGAPADQVLERHAKLEPIPGGGDFALGKSTYRVFRVVPWDQCHVSCRLPPPPESGMSPPPPATVLRLTAPACAEETPIRVTLGGRVLAERLQPGYQFLAVPRHWLEGMGTEGGLELELDAGTPIPEDFQAVWLHPDGPLEMLFGPGHQPSCGSYLSDEFREFAGLKAPEREYPYWEAPVLAVEFAGDGTIRLPDGLDGGEGAAGTAYVVKLGMNAMYRAPHGWLEVTVSLPEFPDVPPQTAVLPHTDRRQTFRFVFRDLPHAPGRLRIHAGRDAEPPPAIKANPRSGNVQLEALLLYAVREVDSLSVQVGEPEDGTLLDDGFYGREHAGDPGHGRWTDGECAVFLPLKGGRDYRLALAYDQLRPEGEPPAEPRLELNGHPLETQTTDSGLETRLPAEWLDGTNRLVIRTRTWSPAAHGAGDDRELGIFLRQFRAEPI